jgi:hypothetical protein
MASIIGTKRGVCISSVTVMEGGDHIAFIIGKDKLLFCLYYRHEQGRLYS